MKGPPPHPAQRPAGASPDDRRGPLGPRPRNAMIRTRRALFFLRLLPLAVLLAAGCGGTDDTLPPMNDAAADARPLPPRGHAWVVIGTDTVIAEVADTPAARERGLMFRTELEDGRGMLFVFEDEQPRGFWMRDTYIALDIAYLDRTQRIIDIQQMEPHVEELYESAAPAMFALEVPQGWFEAHGIQVGDQARIVFGRR